jgi:glutamyl-tRNA synthetase/glutamyl-Q tRNA(Asp) synthetase
MRAIITRFAPAPTGFLHLGHVVNAIYVWGMARRANGRVLLRIEDHDRQRSRAVYEQAIIEDLEWLGFDADGPLVRQSERGHIYDRALAQLRAEGFVYPCSCSRADIVAAVATDSIDRGPNSSPPYPGTCRTRAVAAAPHEDGRADSTDRADRTDGRDVSLRVRLEPATMRFVDLRHGAQQQEPFRQCGDLVIRDRERNWTYQFAVTVDDMEQGITLVVRGDDLLDSTGRQLQLAALLGRGEAPRFLHHPLIVKGGGGASPPQKLSKSDGDTGVRHLRAAGWTAQRVIGHAAFQAGLVPDSRDVSADEVSSIMPAFREADR